MNFLQTDANFIAPSGYAVGGGHHRHHHHHRHGGEIYGGVAEYGAIYGGKGTKEGAKKAREKKTHKKRGEHSHLKVKELKEEAKARGIVGFSKMRKHELLKALGHESGHAKEIKDMLYIVPYVGKKEKKGPKTKRTVHHVAISNLRNKRDALELKDLAKLMKMSLKKLEKLEL